jgi:hypothetical protein
VAELFAERGSSDHIRLGNRSELSAKAIKAWLVPVEAKILCVESDYAIAGRLPVAAAEHTPSATRGRRLIGIGRGGCGAGAAR